MSSSGVQERDCPFKTLLSDTDKVRVDGSKTYHSRVNLFKHSYCSPHVSVYLLRLQRVSLLLGFINGYINYFIFIRSIIYMLFRLDSKYLYVVQIYLSNEEDILLRESVLITII